MKWIKRIIEKLFRKNKVILIEAPKQIDNTEELKNNFKVMIKQTADLERDDGNGYKIAPKIRLEDMV